MKKIIRLLLPCLLLLACPLPAQADNGLGMAYLFGYGGYGNYGGGVGGFGMTSYNSNVPYFALHPPVYYGQRFARPYGASPFAAWPQLQTSSAYAPQLHVERAHIIDNPYCGTAASGVSEQVITQAAPIQPLEIDNPYYQADPRYTSVD
ncbi:MAG: hypothetical protein KDA51_20270 [Planctomycetales bacterium]|nr:hypothetical protein [Planctomycetales bacterium]